MVEVCGTITRDGEAVMEVTSQFLYRGTYTDFENTFQRKVETPVQLHLAHLQGRRRPQVQGMVPTSTICLRTLSSLVRRSPSVCRASLNFKNKDVFSSIQTVRSGPSRAAHQGGHPGR